MRWLVFFSLLPLWLMAKNPTLLVFMRPDTCPWCGKLEEEILSQKAFQKNIEGKIDVQRCTSLEMEDQFHITEVPTLILLSSKGEEITRLGYDPLTPEAFAEHLLKICSIYVAIESEMENMQQLTLEQLKMLYQKVSAIPCNQWKEKVLEYGLQKDRGVFFLTEKYTMLKAAQSKKAHDVRLQILERDKKALFPLAIIDSQHRFQSNEPISSVIKPLKRYIKKTEEKDNVWRAHLFIAQYLIREEQWEEALKHATMAEEMAPDAEKKQAEDTLIYLKGKTQ